MASNDTTPESYSGQNAANRPSKQQIFNAISNRRRRAVIQALVETPTHTTSELSGSLAASRHDCDVAELKSQQRKREYVALYQTHLEKLDEVGVIDWDKQRGDVLRGEFFWAFADVLEAASGVCGMCDIGGESP